RLPGSESKWLNTQTDTLHIEREVAYTIPDSAVWSLLDASSAVGGNITVRLGFAEKGKYPKIPEDPPADLLLNLFERATDAMPLPRLDLRNIADGQPQSILPDIVVDWPPLPDVHWMAGNPVPEAATPRFMFCGSMPFAFQA